MVVVVVFVVVVVVVDVVVVVVVSISEWPSMTQVPTRDVARDTWIGM